MKKITRQQTEKFNETVFRNILEEAIEWIRDNMEPEDVFEEEVLEAWAEANDFVKSE
jgi:hypothetical protein